MSAYPKIIVIPAEQIDLIFNQLSTILNDVQELKKIRHSPEENTILTTKEAMALLKISHPTNFKNYLLRNSINPISETKPLRFSKSQLLNTQK